MMNPAPTSLLPVDADKATLIGRMLTADGPTPIAVLGGVVFDMSAVAPTVADLIAGLDEGAALPPGRPLGRFDEMGFTAAFNGGDGARLLAPVDLQCIKACGVTFAVSALERVIEERALGDYAKAEQLRAGIQERIGGTLSGVKPGSEAAAKLKAVLIAESMWSQYLEVAIGPHAEVFTKAPILASVGWGDEVGVRDDSDWNNPEPEIVIIVDPKGRARGAALGNDVNLRDIEGRSALLLGKAKDNNASCSIGPFIRLFDDHFTLDDVRQSVVSLEVEGPDNFRMEGSSTMSLISRDPLELVGQTISKNHQYPDGFAVFLGTMFAPTADRGDGGRGFTHKVGDIVRIASPRLGVLENRVTLSENAPPWTFGVSALMRNLAGRGLLKT